MYASNEHDVISNKKENKSNINNSFNIIHIKQKNNFKEHF